MSALCAITLASLTEGASGRAFGSEELFGEERKLTDASNRIANRLERKYQSLMNAMKSTSSPRKLPSLTRATMVAEESADGEPEDYNEEKEKDEPEEPKDILDFTKKNYNPKNDPIRKKMPPNTSNENRKPKSPPENHNFDSPIDNLPFAPVLEEIKKLSNRQFDPKNKGTSTAINPEDTLSHSILDGIVKNIGSNNGMPKNPVNNSPDTKSNGLGSGEPKVDSTDLKRPNIASSRPQLNHDDSIQKDNNSPDVESTGTLRKGSNFTKGNMANLYDAYAQTRQNPNEKEGVAVNPADDNESLSDLAKNKQGYPANKANELSVIPEETERFGSSNLRRSPDENEDSPYDTIDLPEKISGVRKTPSPGNSQFNSSMNREPAVGNSSSSPKIDAHNKAINGNPQLAANPASKDYQPNGTVDKTGTNNNFSGVRQSPIGQTNSIASKTNLTQKQDYRDGSIQSKKFENSLDKSNDSNYDINGTQTPLIAGSQNRIPIVSDANQLQPGKNPNFGSLEEYDDAIIRENKELQEFLKQQRQINQEHHVNLEANAKEVESRINQKQRRPAQSQGNFIPSGNQFITGAANNHQGDTELFGVESEVQPANVKETSNWQKKKEAERMDIHEFVRSSKYTQSDDSSDSHNGVYNGSHSFLVPGTFPVSLMPQNHSNRLPPASLDTSELISIMSQQQEAKAGFKEEAKAEDHIQASKLLKFLNNQRNEIHIESFSDFQHNPLKRVPQEDPVKLNEDIPVVPSDQEIDHMISQNKQDETVITQQSINRPQTQTSANRTIQTTVNRNPQIDGSRKIPISQNSDNRRLFTRYQTAKPSANMTHNIGNTPLIVRPIAPANHLNAVKRVAMSRPQNVRYRMRSPGKIML